MREAVIHERSSYLRDAVFAASDGLVTTFAVVAGSQGASLSQTVVIIMGFANLFADGISMSSGTYLGTKSEEEFEQKEGDRHVNRATPARQAMITFFAFGLAGFIPLFPYVLASPKAFELSVLFVIFSLFAIGAIRGKYTGKRFVISGLESLFIGGIAAIVAYATGDIIANFT